MNPETKNDKSILGSLYELSESISTLESRMSAYLPYSMEKVGATPSVCSDGDGEALALVKSLNDRIVSIIKKANF